MKHASTTQRLGLLALALTFSQPGCGRARFTVRAELGAPAPALTLARVAQPTARVAQPTPEPPASCPEAQRAPEQRYDADTQLGFSPHNHWLQLRDADAGNTTFVDVRQGSALALHEELAEGEGGGDATLVSAADYDLLSEVSRAGVVMDPTEQRTLYQGPEGLRVVNLLTGRREFVWASGAASGASFEQRGRALAWTDRAGGRVHVVAFDTGAHRSYGPAPREGAEVSWTDEGSLAWTASDGSVRVVEPAREGEGDTYRWAGHDAESFAFAPRQRTLAVSYLTAGFALFHAGAAEPHARFEAVRAVDAHWDASGARVAWAEERETELASDGAAAYSRFHVTDAESGQDVALTGRGDCPLAPETIDRLVGNELVTNSECSPGCPSSAWSADRNVYDATTGAFVRARVEGSSPAASGMQSALQTRVQRLVRRHHATGPALLDSAEAHFIVRVGASLRAVTTAGAERAVTLVGSGAHNVAAMLFSSDGALVAGVDAQGVARLWQTSDGSVLWSSAGAAR